MENLTRMRNQWDARKRECLAIVETPKGSSNKFDYNPDYELFSLGGLLAEGLVFPFDFGFVPSTIAEDGDPVDVMILMDAPAFPGCLLNVRIIGAIEAYQDDGSKRTVNNRLIGVSIHSHNHGEVAKISELNQGVLDQVEEFFVSYNKSRGKLFAVEGRRGPKRAAALLEQGMRTFRARQKK
ncbi:MAG: Inorganic pyrophosphatase [Betaproteobacteria bacterium]|nr:Inorganic pyrophosphatase [Betaproteobacteria bacterium]